MNVTLFLVCLGCLVQPIRPFLLTVTSTCLLCGNHGKCNPLNLFHICVCDHGYDGFFCHQATCVIENCNGRGICKDTTEGAECTCDPHYIGKHCENQNAFNVVDATSTSAAGPLFTPAPTQSGISTATSAAGPLFTPAPTQSSNPTSTSAAGPLFTPAPTQSGNTTATSAAGPLFTFAPKQAGDIPTTATALQLSSLKSMTNVTCSGSGMAHSVAMMNIHLNNGACTCSSGSCASPEAFMLDLCKGLTSSQSWKPGTKVMRSCDDLPLYSPIASFKDGIYTTKDITGILVKCTADGFMIATQTCDRPPIIQTITHSRDGLSSSLNIHDFYTIQI